MLGVVTRRNSRNVTTKTKAVKVGRNQLGNCTLARYRCVLLRNRRELVAEDLNIVRYSSNHFLPLYFPSFIVIDLWSISGEAAALFLVK